MLITLKSFLYQVKYLVNTGTGTTKLAERKFCLEKRFAKLFILIKKLTLFQYLYIRYNYGYQ